MGPFRRAVLLAALMAAGLVAPIGAPAGAAVSGASATAERREELQDELLEATAAEARLIGELDAAEARRDELAGQLADVEGRVAAAQQALEAAEQAEADATARASAAEAELRRTSDRLDEALGLLQNQAVSAFMSGGAAADLNGLLELEDIHEVEQAKTYTEAVVEHQDTIVDEIARLRDEVAELAATAEAARAAAVAAATEAELQRDGLAAERDRVAVLRGEADAVAVHQTELLDVAHQQRASVEAELAALEAVSSSITSWLASSQSGQVATAATRGTFSIPVPSARISSGFGPRTHPIYGDTRVHKGTDFAAPSGTPIAAAGAGTVVAAGPQGGYGNVVIIDHGNALATLYAHQSRLAVVVGQTVVAGETIGAVGSTGNSTGPHLHFEVRLYGTPVNPLAYL
jgi:murein DD-endopeptidase MepM/ murein hydrolase activator NlpD